jgi:branched-chain amino acid transport system permease protein
MHFGVCLVLGALVAGLFGMLVGIPCLRLSGDYLAIATLAFAEIFRLVLENLWPDLLGGPKGLRLAPGKLDSDIALICLVVGVVVVVILTRNLKYSATGRGFQAIRENEIAARTMGMNISVLKIQAFAISSAMAGLAGVLFTFSQWTISPGNFDLKMTIMILLMVVLGGAGSITGSIIGAFILGIISPLIRLTPDFAKQITEAPWLIDSLDKAKQNPEIIFSVLLIVLIRWRPQGIMGMAELSDLWKKRGLRSKNRKETVK